MLVQIVQELQGIILHEIFAEAAKRTCRQPVIFQTEKLQVDMIIE